MLLTEYLDDSFKYGKRKLKVDMSFDNILRFYDLTNDDSFNDEEKMLIGLELLLYNYNSIADKSTMEEKYELFKYILKEFLNEDVEQKESEEKQKEGEEEQKDFENNEEEATRDFDFKIDAERIYASFVMDYRIDLFEQQGKLHWGKFIALFNGLSDETPFRKVVNVRTMEIPEPTKYNQKERAKMQKLKSKYALEQKDMNKALDQVADYFRQKAGDNKK